jgi:dihydrolipoamide dehydrogenase
MDTYDVVVIGAGPGGYVAAIRAAQMGAKVAVIEKDQVGGVCLNWGCIPTKTLIYTAELYRKMQRASEYGIDVGDFSLNMKQVVKRKNDVVRRNKNGIQALFKAHNIELIKGEAVVTGPGMVKVDGQSIKAKGIIVATGSQPAQIPGLETDGKTVITSTEALELTELPARIAVIGAGALGAEFASLWNIFGVKVTLIEMMPQILPFEDIELAQRMEKIFQKRGMDIRTGTTVHSMTRGKNGARLELQGDKAGSIDVDLVLVGIGRKYNSEALTSGGLKVNLGPRGQIVVNDRLETSIPGVYAIGDVVGRTLLAHGASAEALIAAENATGGNRRINYRVVPACTFTSPEVAHVGLTEKQAREQGIDVKVGRFDHAASGRAAAMGETEGMVKIVGDVATDEVLGVHIMGPEAGELIAAAAMAMSLEATVEEIAHTIHTHPTLSETVMEAAEAYLGRGIHTPPRK